MSLIEEAANRTLMSIGIDWVFWMGNEPAGLSPSYDCEIPSSTGWTLPDELREYEQEGRNDFIAELVSCFLMDAEERLRILRKAASMADFALLAKQFHSLKGSSSSMGLSEVVGLCHGGEEKARSGMDAEYARMIDSIEAALTQVRPAMIAYCA